MYKNARMMTMMLAMMILKMMKRRKRKRTKTKIMMKVGIVTLIPRPVMRTMTTTKMMILTYLLLHLKMLFVMR